MVRPFVFPLVLVLAGLSSLPAISASPADSATTNSATSGIQSAELARVVQDAWDLSLKLDPISATQMGEHRYDHLLPDASLASVPAGVAAKEALVKRVEAIDRDKLSRGDQINRDILLRMLRDELVEAKLESYLVPITNRSGFHIEFADLPSRIPPKTLEEYKNYIARLRAFGKYVDQHIDVMRKGIETRIVLPAIVLQGYRSPIETHIVDDPEKSLLFAPLRRFPDAIPPAEREKLTAAAKAAITEAVVPGYKRFLAFMEKEYVPAASGEVGVSARPHGRDLYRHRVKHFTTLELTPEQVHQTGLSEVARIRAEMEEVVRKSGFTGDFAAFLKYLRTDPRFYAKSPEALMQHVSLICKKIDGQLPKLFKTLPRTPYGLKEIPAYIAPGTTSAYYQPPRGDGLDGGYYYLNTFNLKSRPFYEMEALSLHEAVPGHHLQIALQQELTDLPKFRRFSGVTAFIEGWGLYSERLGLEVGFYQDPYTDFGRLTFEMWRACRLVVDTGMHYLGWSRQRAIDFMAANTALSLHNIEAEVDRYISWPGQALAYKIGELKIRSLRHSAEEKLGSKFDIREFHDVVLKSGAVPLDILEQNVNDYIAATAKEGAAAAATTTMTYPDTRKSDQVDTLHGVKVADPYRWLEDDNSAETKAWVEAQNKVTFGYLDQIALRKPLRERLTKLWNYERFGIPTPRGGRYFYERNDGLQNQSVLYVADSLEAEPRVLLDPNTLSKDGTVALGETSLSDDGNLLAYSISTAGSDWREWKVRDVATGKDTTDHLQWAKFSGASWTKDHKGFYYSRYDAPKEGEKLTGANYFQKLYYHRLGTPQSEDKLIHHRPDRKELGFQGSVTDDGKYLAVHVWFGSSRKNGVSYQDLTQPDAKVIDVLTDFESEYDLVGNDGPVFFFKTDSDAPRGRLIAIDMRKPEKANWRDVVPQAEGTLVGASLVGEHFVVTYLQDVRHVVKVYDLSGKFVRNVDLPGIGSVGGFGGRRQDKETFYLFTSYTTPSNVYRYDVTTGQSTLFRKPKVAFNPDDFETSQVFVPSKDGTRVPMFITHKKGLKRDGNTPTLLYAYGGFNISLQPSFSVSSIVWMEQGGVWAVANLRGGGDYGRVWHEGGMLDRKQNVFNDFISCAEWLIDNKYTSRDKLAIQGGSNGGLLVGACMTQRPDLYAVCLPAVGVMDMLRYHKFTIGWAWVPEYGSADDAKQFENLIKYSPLHSLKPGTKYPATMVTTADHDDRVVPAHSFKFAAALQAAHKGDDPVLIRIETEAGHGAGKPTSKRIEEAADLIGFALHQMGVRQTKDQ